HERLDHGVPQFTLLFNVPDDAGVACHGNPLLVPGKGHVHFTARFDLADQIGFGDREEPQVPVLGDIDDGQWAAVEPVRSVGRHHGDANVLQDLNHLARIVIGHAGSPSQLATSVTAHVTDFQD